MITFSKSPLVNQELSFFPMAPSTIGMIVSPSKLSERLKQFEERVDYSNLMYIPDTSPPREVG